MHPSSSSQRSPRAKCPIEAFLQCEGAYLALEVLPETPKRNDLNEAELSAVIAELFKGSKNGVLGKGDFSRVAVAELYGSNRWTFAGLWKEYRRQKGAVALCVLTCTTSVAEIAAKRASTSTFRARL